MSGCAPKAGAQGGALSTLLYSAVLCRIGYLIDVDLLAARHGRTVRERRCLLRYHAVVDQVAHDARPGGAVDGRNVSPSLPSS
jgi:hypothetical protein